MGAIANMPQFYEFFAGAGMARQGLGSEWKCLYANDFEPMKVSAYEANWGKGHIHLADINEVQTSDLPGQADMAWASFPCQDLSLAGNGAGIGYADDSLQTRSGTFWAFWRLMSDLRNEGRGPRIVVLENVYGVLRSNGGRDFAAIGECFARQGYRFGAMVMDAVHYLPQSRPRVFIVGIAEQEVIDPVLQRKEPDQFWHPQPLVDAVSRMTAATRDQWVWWNVQHPRRRARSLSSIITDQPDDVSWNSPADTQRLVSMMSPINRRKLEQMLVNGKRVVGTAYRRTRGGIQRTELRTDGVAGCLRTPGGGSSRQIVVVVQEGEINTRLMSAREAADLMGLPSSFKLPASYNDAYHVSGDGVAVPVVDHLARSLLDPIAAVSRSRAYEELSVLQAAE